MLPTALTAVIIAVGVAMGVTTSTDGTREFSTAMSAESGPAGITADPDGNLWFTEFDGDRIGRITPAGAVTEVAKGISPGSQPSAIAAGPDGNLWFTETGGDRIGRITPTGLVTEFSKGISAGSLPRGIAAGPDGDLWFTEFEGDRIGRITPQGVISEYPPTAAIVSVRLRGTRAVGVRVLCPSGAARECRGTLRLMSPWPFPEQRLGVGRLTVAPGRRAEVVVSLWAAGRTQLRAQRRLSLRVVLVPSAHSLAGSVQRGLILRLSRPPAVAG